MKQKQFDLSCSGLSLYYYIRIIIYNRSLQGCSCFTLLILTLLRFIPMGTFSSLRFRRLIIEQRRP